MAITWDKNETRKQPEVPEQRDIAGELVPAAFSVAGSAIGTRLGGVPGGLAGAVSGGVIGETVQQGIEKTFGLRDSLNYGQIAGQGVISGGLDLSGALFARFAKPAFQASKPTLVKFVSKMSGYSDDVLETALKRTPGAIQGAKQGEQALADVVKRTASGISKYATDLVTENGKKVAEFSTRSVSGNLPGTKQELLKESTKFAANFARTLRSDFNIGVDKTGTLLFDRARDMSNIVSTADRSAIQGAYTAIRSIGKNPDINHIDSVLERLITLRTKTPVGAPTGAETRAIISKMSDSVVDFVRSVPKTYGSGYANYVKHLEETLPKRILINDAKELFGSSKNLSPKEVAQIEKRLLQLYNTGNLELRNFASKVGTTVKEDIVGTAAGTLVKTGDQMSIRAPNLTARGVATKIAEFLPREIVENYVATGKLTGELSTTVKAIAKVLGVTEQVILNALTNLSTNKTEE